MIRDQQIRLARVRGLCAALFLLITAVSAPIVLATQTADACGMTCCIKDGICCCEPHHASVKGHIPDGKPSMSTGDLSASCPDNCVPAARFSNSLLRDRLLASVTQAFPDDPPVISLEGVVAPTSRAEAGSIGPRAPPPSITL